jgi:phenylacetic acid degradation operon negative regulatory protein
LHLAELREGIWIRPDNLDPDRLPTQRAVLDRQCVHFHGAATDIPVHNVRSLFNLDVWADDARRLTRAMRDELHSDAGDTADFTYQFALSIAVVRHLQLDPLLPAELIPDEWPGRDLRATYRRFDELFKRRLNSAFR